MKLGADVPWFVLRCNFEGDILENHVTADVNIFLKKKNIVVTVCVN